MKKNLFLIISIISISISIITCQPTEKTENPVFTPEGGVYNNIINISISSETEGATIYFTLDGSEPTHNSKEYSSPISVSEPVTIKAIAVKEGFLASDIVSEEYTLSGWIENIVFSNKTDENDYLGESVAIYTDNKVLAGALFDEYNDIETGVAYLFEKDEENMSWTETAFYPSDAIVGVSFGDYVAVSDGGVILVSATEDDTMGNNAGAVYMYRKDNQDYIQTKFTASDGEDFDGYGEETAISSDGNKILIGSPYDDDAGTTTGSVYYYKWVDPDWVETKITASDMSESQGFGISVDMSHDGQTLLIGAHIDDSVANNAGAVYVYKWDGSQWGETKIQPAQLSEDDRFGRTVAISQDGNRFVASAWGDDENGTNAGSIYVYDWNGTDWSGKKIIASEGDKEDWFGYTVDISWDGDTIISGAIYDEQGGDDAGAVYIFERNGTEWLEKKLLPVNSSVGESFGSSISINSDGNVFAVGCVKDSDNGTDAGIVYVYKYYP